MRSAATADHARRILRHLERGPAKAAAASSPGTVVLEREDGSVIAVSLAALTALVEAGQVEREGFRLRLRGGGSDAGAGVVETACKDMPRINDAESPLTLLRRLRLRDGRAFLSDEEFDAGERLRSDYTRGRLMPRMGANWIASVSSGRRGAAGGAVELTDAALAARQRVDRACQAVGPELSSILVDICCFLKGFEQVELERGWPVRSAKVVLKTALGALARHYDPKPARNARLVHWGGEGYRPTVP